MISINLNIQIVVTATSPIAKISIKKLITELQTFVSESNRAIVGFESTLSTAHPTPKRHAKITAGSRYCPLSSESNPEYGNNALIFSKMFIVSPWITLSAEIGIRGNLMIKMDTSPSTVSKTVAETITSAVIEIVLKNLRVSRSLKTATVKLKNISGTRNRRTVLIAISARKLTIPVSVR